MGKLERRLREWTLIEEIGHLLIVLIAKFNRGWDKKLLRVRWGKGD